MTLIEGYREKICELINPGFGISSWHERGKMIAKDLVFGTVGLFVLDVSWRLMDFFIDFICDHIHWLKWLSDNT